MIYIRKGVFETNSSSSHSIVMMKGDRPSKTIKGSNMVDGGWHVNKNGTMSFWFESDLEFGRSPFDLLTDWYGRLRYAIASFADSPEKIDELEQICQKRIAGFVKFEFREDSWGHGDYHGYVDHQSSGILEHAFNKYNVSLENFIFNDRYIVVIDGDEYCLFDTFMHTDMFNKDSIEDCVPPLEESEEEEDE